MACEKIAQKPGALHTAVANSRLFALGPPGASDILAGKVNNRVKPLRAGRKHRAPLRIPRPTLTQDRDLRLRANQADRTMAAGVQERHQVRPDESARACDKYSQGGHPVRSAATRRQSSNPPTSHG